MNSDDIRQHIAEFKKRGGKIQKIKTGVSGEVVKHTHTKRKQLEFEQGQDKKGTKQ